MYDKAAQDKYRASHKAVLKARHIKWRLANRDYYNAQQRARRKAHPECTRTYNKTQKLKPDYRSKVQLMNKQRAERRAGRPKPALCELCGRGGRIVFDHDHATDKFRGWLCNKCNVILGQAADSPELLRKLAAYIELNRRAVSEN